MLLRWNDLLSNIKLAFTEETREKRESWLIDSSISLDTLDPRALLLSMTEGHEVKCRASGQKCSRGVPYCTLLCQWLSWWTSTDTEACRRKNDRGWWASESLICRVQSTSLLTCPGKRRQVVTPLIVADTRWFKSPYVGVVSLSVRKQMSYRASLSMQKVSSVFSTNWWTESVAL